MRSLLFSGLLTLLVYLPGKTQFLNSVELQVADLAQSDIERPLKVDLDNDGDQDIIYRRYSPDNNIYWLENVSTPGSLKFESPQALTNDSISMIKFALVDIDLDGDVDIVTMFQPNGNRVEREIYLYENHFNEKRFFFDSPKYLFTVPEANIIYAADLDGNNYPDIVFYDNYFNPNYWAANQYDKAPYQFGSLRNIPEAGRSVARFIDVNKDGALDIISGRNILINQIKENKPEDWLTWHVFMGERFLVGDLTQNGSVGILWQEGDGPVYWINDYMDARETAQFVDIPQYLRLLTLTDIDLDGDQDIILVSGGDYNKTLYWLENQSEPSALKIGEPKLIGKDRWAFIQSLMFDDFDLDGDVDLINAILNTQNDHKFYWTENQGIGPEIVLAKPVPNQQAHIGSDFKFTLGDDFFTVDGDATLQYTATLRDGSPLPAWLDFNPDNKTFSGRPPSGQLGIIPLKVTLTATRNTLSTNRSATFDIIVQDPQGPISWVEFIGSISELAHSTSINPAFDSKNNLVLSGRIGDYAITQFMNSGTTLHNADKLMKTFLAKYDPSGVLQWAKVLDFQSYYGKFVIDNADNIYMVEVDTWTSQEINILHKYAPDGTLLWNREIATGFKLKLLSIDEGNTLCLLSENNVLVKVNLEGEIIQQIPLENLSGIPQGVIMVQDKIYAFKNEGEPGSRDEVHSTHTILYRFASNGKLEFQRTLTGGNLFTGTLHISKDHRIYLGGGGKGSLGIGDWKYILEPSGSDENTPCDYNCQAVGFLLQYDLEHDKVLDFTRDISVSDILFEENGSVLLMESVPHQTVTLIVKIKRLASSGKVVDDFTYTQDRVYVGTPLQLFRNSFGELFVRGVSGCRVNDFESLLSCDQPNAYIAKINPGQLSSVSDFTSIDILVSPNPGDQEIDVKLNDSANAWNIRIVDRSGKTVHKYVSTKPSFTLDISHLPQSIYILTAESNHRKGAFRFIKQ